MLANKEVNKIRTMYYKQNYTATEIARIMKISRQTIYKYLKFVDFSDEVTQKKSKSEVEKYREDILNFLNYDRLHHHKQRHTGRKVYDRLKELYPNYDISYSATVKFFSRVKKNSIINTMVICHLTIDLVKHKLILVIVLLLKMEKRHMVNTRY